MFVQTTNQFYKILQPHVCNTSTNKYENHLTASEQVTKKFYKILQQNVCKKIQLTTIKHTERQTNKKHIYKLQKFIQKLCTITSTNKYQVRSAAAKVFSLSQVLLA